MRQKLKFSVAILLVTGMLFSVVACKGDKKGTLPPVSAVNPKGKVVFTTLAGNDDQCQAALNFVDAFNQKYPDVEVEMDTENLSTIGSTRDARISSGEIGDVYWIGDTDTYNYAIMQQACEPLDYYLEQFQINVDNVYAGIYNLGVANGRLYMVSRDHNHLVFTYNRTALQNENLADPKPDWTWNDFLTYCQALTKSEDGNNTFTQIGANVDAWDPLWMAFAKGWGGEPFDTVNKKVSLVSDPKVYDGFNALYTAMADGYINRWGAPSSTYPNYDPYSTPVFKSIVFPSLADVGLQYESRGLDWDLANFPKLPTPKVGTGSSGHVVYRNSKHKEAAAALCLFFFTEEGQTAYNSAIGGSVPLMKSLADQDFWKVPYEGKDYSVFVSNPDNDTVGRINCIIPPSVGAKINIPAIIQSALENKKSLSDGLKEAEQAANEQWAKISKLESLQGE